MLGHNRVKLISMLMGICLASSFMQAYALGDALTGSASLSHGAEEWGNNCGRCHNLRPSTEFSPNQWQTIMLHMRIQAGITGQKARNIYAFLSGQSATTQKSPVAVETKNDNIASSTISVKTLMKTKLAANTSAVVNTNQAQTTGSSQVNPSPSGGTIYQQTCVACHGANGKGAVPGAPDFTSANGPLQKSDAVLLQHIINGFQSPGSSMPMPPRGGNPKLTDDNLKSVLSYIRSKFGK